MLKQINFEFTAPRHALVSTSFLAAKKAAPKAKSIRELALAELEKHPLTADEIAERIGRGVFSVRPRISDMKADGLIEDSGLERPSCNGDPAIVWKIRNE